jgi:hypothetical protein
MPALPYPVLETSSTAATEAATTTRNTIIATLNRHEKRPVHSFVFSKTDMMVFHTDHMEWG